MTKLVPDPESYTRALFWPATRQDDDDDVYYYIRWRLKLEGETGNMCVCTKESDDDDYS